MRILIAVGLLLLSGWASGYGISHFDYGEDAKSFNLVLFYGPGIWFGLVVAILMRNNFINRMKGACLWVIWSIISWYMALQVAFSFEQLVPVVMILAGATGATALGLGLNKLIGWRLNERLWIFLIVGAISGGAMHLLAIFNDRLYALGTILGFILWQLAVGLTILFQYRRKPLKKSR